MSNQIGIILLIIIVVLTLIFLLRFIHAYLLRKKIGRYALEVKNVNKISFLEELNDTLEIVFNKTENLLLKSHFCKKISHNYYKYLDFYDREEKYAIKYLNLQLFSGLLWIILGVISLNLKALNINVFVVSLCFIIGLLVPYLYWEANFYINKKEARDDLYKAVVIMNNAFKSNKTMLQTLKIVKKELDGVVGREFGRVHDDISSGLSVPNSFERLEKRLDNPEVKYITAALTVLDKTGGDITKAFSLIEEGFTNRYKLDKELKSLTGQSTLLFWFLVTLPFVLVFGILLLNGEYFAVLFENVLGVVIILIILLLYVAYIFIARKMLLGKWGR